MVAFFADDDDIVSEEKTRFVDAEVAAAKLAAPPRTTLFHRFEDSVLPTPNTNDFDDRIIIIFVDDNEEAAAAILVVIIIIRKCDCDFL